MVITSEYSTGMIRTSLTAQPRRGTVYAAKAIVFAAVTLVISLFTSFVAFFVGQALLSGKGVAASLFHTVTIPANANVNCPGGGPGSGPALHRDVLRHRRDLTASTVLDRDHRHRAVRHGRRADRVRRRLDHPAHGGHDRLVIALMFVLPIIEHTLPDNWRWDIMRFLPDAASQVVSVTDRRQRPRHLWSAWPQFGVTALWARGPGRDRRLPVPQARRIGAGLDNGYHRTTERAALLPASGRRPGRAGGAIASEFTKLRSVRSTYWTLGGLFIVSVGLGLAITAGTAANMVNNPRNKAGFDATQISLGAFFELGQLIIAVIGAMVITSEYSTGMIRTSLTAQPRRGVVYAAKAIAFTAVTLVISLVTSFVAFFVGQTMYSGKGVAASLFHTVTIPANAMVNCLGGGGGSVPDNHGPGAAPGCGHLVVTFSGTDVITASTVLTAIIGTALFVTIVALIAFGVGSIVRHTAGTIAIVIALMFIVPILEQTAAERLAQRHHAVPAGRRQPGRLHHDRGNGPGHLWSAWPQLGVTALWAVVLIGIGAYLFRKRDA